MGEPRRYRVFWRAARALMHPVSIVAVVLLIANDHWLRVWYPSWLTGKLGDLTWLVFAPFLCLMLLAWVMPLRWLKHADKLAFGFIGVWFATAKTIPAAHWLTVTLSGMLQESPSTLRMDATDLLTLPALLLGWWVWRHVADAAPPAIRQPSRLWLIFGLALLSTIASDDGITYIDGITQICIIDDQLVAYTYAYEPYAVSDLSGEAWMRSGFDLDELAYSDTHYCGQKFIVEHPDIPDVAYQFEPGQYIEFSTDGLVTRQIIYDLPEYDREVYIRLNLLMGNEMTFVERDDEPHMGIIEPDSGRVFFAMGTDGILMYDRANPLQPWTWIQVGQFKLARVESVTHVFEILLFETFLAAALFFLVVTHAVFYVREGYGFHRLILMVGRWSWVILIVFFLTPYQLEDDYAIGFVALGLSVIIALPLSVAALWDILLNYPRRFPVIAVTGFILAAMFYFPYVLWSFGLIAQHRSASLFALMLAAAGAFAADNFLRPRLPVLGQPPMVETLETLSTTPSANYPLDRDLWTEEPSDDASSGDASEDDPHA